ncbi:MAG: ankyrin repeat domain-containing protein [Bacteroidia bacterium]|nr:ankyrin repeat domain-containing protein [Bacteroidia bacterium]
MNQDTATRTLIENGYFPEISPKTQEDFLRACKDGKEEVVKAYIALGMPLECRAEWGEQTPLVKAAEGNNIAITNLLLEAGADMENKDGDGDTALHTAANWGNFEVLKALHKKGAKVDTLNKYGYTPLTGALKNDKDTIYRYLLKYANPNLFPEDYGSLLHYCIYQNNDDELKEVFKNAAVRPDPEIKDSQGDNLLMYAAKRDNEFAVSVLLKNGANAKTINAAGWTPYYYALYEGKTGMAKLLKPDSDLSIGEEVYKFCSAVRKRDMKSLAAMIQQNNAIRYTDAHGQSPLFIATEKGKEQDALSFMEWLIEQGADINAQTLAGLPVVETLVNTGKTKAASLLLQKGANPNRADGICYLWYTVFDKGDISLANQLLVAGANIQNLGEIKLALEYGSAPAKKMIEVIRLLGEKGANFNILDKTISDSLLGELAGRLKSDKVMALIEAGADVNFADKNNYTPLNKLASGYDTTKKEAEVLATYLLEKGASLESEGDFGGTPGYNAVSQKNKYVQSAIEKFIRKPLTECMLKYGVSNLAEAPEDFVKEFAATQNNATLMEWVRWKEYEVVSLLLKAGVPPDPKKPKSMESPLYLAVKENDARMVEILLVHGAKPDYEMKYGSSCLSTAAYCKEKNVLEENQKILNLLIQYGADVNRLSEYKENAIGSAVSAGNKENIEILLRAGAKLDAYPCGWSPLMRAVQADNKKMTEWLLKKKAPLNNVNSNRQNALHLAITKENTDIAILLMEHKIDIQKADEKGETPLIMAVKKGNEGLIEALLAFNADPYYKDNSGKSALQYAALRKNLSKYFQAFASSRSDEPGDTFTVFQTKPLTPLLTAIYMRDEETAKSLIEAGEDINQSNYRGDTPLMIALFMYQTSLAEWLIEKGADVKKQNKWKDEAYGICYAYNLEDMKKKIEEKGVKISMDYLNQMAAIQMRMEDAHKLLNSGDVSGFDKCLKEGELDIHVWNYTTTPLHKAVERNDEAMTELLLKRGANPDFPDWYGNRPVDITEDAAISDILAEYMSKK